MKDIQITKATESYPFACTRTHEFFGDGWPSAKIVLDDSGTLYAAARMDGERADSDAETWDIPTRAAGASGEQVNELLTEVAGILNSETPWPYSAVESAIRDWEVEVSNNSPAVFHTPAELAESGAFDAMITAETTDEEIKALAGWYKVSDSENLITFSREEEIDYLTGMRDELRAE